MLVLYVHVHVLTMDRVLSLSFARINCNFSDKKKEKKTNIFYDILPMLLLSNPLRWPLPSGLSLGEGNKLSNWSVGNSHSNAVFCHLSLGIVYTALNSPYFHFVHVFTFIALFYWDKWGIEMQAVGCSSPAMLDFSLN